MTEDKHMDSFIAALNRIEARKEKEMIENTNKNLDLLIPKIKANLTPDLLKKQYRQENQSNPFFGHCYVATEALFHLMNNKDRFFIYYGKDENSIVHWWLYDNYSKKIVDITAEQYTSLGKNPPYEKAKRGAFLTKEPSKRAIILMHRVISIAE